MELLKSRIQVHVLSHHVESIFHGDGQGSPHILRDITEGPLAGFHLTFQTLAICATAAEVVDEDMAGILHEYCAIEVYFEILAFHSK